MKRVAECTTFIMWLPKSSCATAIGKNNWGTELVVADEGKKVTLSWGQDYELSRRPAIDPAYMDAYGWRMSMKDGKTE